MTKYDSGYFKDRFPNLYEEIEEDETQSVSVDGVRTEDEEGKKADRSEEDNGPDVIDFIRLCDDEDEALEIINHMEDEKKIEPDYAKELRNQLTHEGLRSFGSKREPGNYSFTD